MKNQCQVLLAVLITIFFVATTSSASRSDDSNASETAKRIKEALRIQRFVRQDVALPQDLPEAFSVDVEHQGVKRTLYLWKHSVRSADYKVVGAKNGRYHHFNPGPVRTYIGVVADDPECQVSAMLDDNGLSAGVYRGRTLQWRIEPLGKALGYAARHEHVVYDAEDEELLPGVCGLEEAVVAEQHEESEDIAVEQTEQLANTAGMSSEEFFAALSEPQMLTGCELHQAQIAYVVDYPSYVKTFSCDITAAQNRVEQVVNELTVIYGRDALITYELTGTIIRNDPAAMGFNAQYRWENAAQADPSTCTFVNDPNTCGLGFAGDWGSQAAAAGITSWHFVHLMSADNPGGILGVAYVPGTVAWSVNSVGVAAHEIGHNWGLGHCDGNGDCHIMCSGYGGCNGNPSFFGDPGALYLRSRGASVSWTANVGAMVDPVPPRAFPDTGHINRDDLIAQGGSFAIDVLANDHDGNCDSLLPIPNGLTDKGGTVSETGGVLFYSPPVPRFVGVDSFTYICDDGNGGQDTADVTVTINNDIVYVDADFGVNGNTVDANTLDPLNWQTTANDSYDTLWRYRTGINTTVPAIGDDTVFEASGHENAVMLKTTIAGLSPGESYGIWIYYGTNNLEDSWKIRAGLTDSSLITFRAEADGVLVADTSDVDMYRSLVGVGVADGNGELAVYIDNYESETQRTWYDGVGYESMSFCGQEGQTYSQGDINRDCYVNTQDLALLADQWLDCTDPVNQGNCDLWNGPQAQMLPQTGLVYVDAEHGTTGNTVDAVTGGPSSWQSTNNDSYDTIWRARSGNGAAAEDDVYEASGHEDAVMLKTTVTGLTEGSYNVYVYFGTSTLDPTWSWDIQAGLAADSLSVLTPQDDGELITDTSDVDMYRALVGVATVDASGELAVYIDNVENGNKRSWYDGIAYELNVPNDYVDAEHGTAGNTVDAVTGDPDSWQSTTNDSYDTIWRTRSGNGATAEDDVYEASGHEDAVLLKTTVAGLAEGFYNVYVHFGTNILDPTYSWDIQAGFVPDQLTTYTPQDDGELITDTSDVDMYRAYIGIAEVHESGELVVYVDNVENGNKRTWYDGIGYESFVPYCGQDGQVYAEADINRDCYVNLEDLSLLGLDWLECNDPENMENCGF